MDVILDLLKRSLLNWHYGDTVVNDMPEWSLRRKLLAGLLRKSGMKVSIMDPILWSQLTDGHGMNTGGYTFHRRFFCETLATTPVEKLAVLRLDGDMYESTMDTLNALYSKLSIGGYLIVDDYQRDNCKQAVIDYRNKHSINDAIHEIDWVSAYWQKT